MTGSIIDDIEPTFYPVTKKIVVASEISDLLEGVPDDVEVLWVSAGEALPGGAADAIVPLLTRKLGAEEMDSVPGLQVIANVATGFDNIDLSAASRRGIVVTNTPDVLTEATADLTFALILGTMRRLKEGMGLLENGEWTGWHPTRLLGRNLTGATLGIVGAGRIGRAVARRAAGFGMEVVYSTRDPNHDPGLIGATMLEFRALLAVSDCVTIHVPLDESTRNLVSSAELAAMKSDAVLINTSRGGIVDETALLDAINSGSIAGAGLDVFDGEPAVNPELIAHPRILSLPHIGSATVETRRAMANLAFRNAVAVISGRPALTPVVVDGGAGPS